MVALGPRVGGAHVDVNLKFDDNSLSSVARRIHQQLTSIGDHNRSVYRSLGRESVTAWRAAVGAAVAGAPHIGSLISGLAGGVTELAGSLYSVAQSSLGLAPIFTSLGLAGATLGIGLNNFFAAVSETSAKGLEDLLKGMPKEMQKAVLSTRALSNEMRAALFPKLFAGLSEGINSLRETGIIQTGLGKMADSLNGLAKSVLAYANSKDGVSTLNKFFDNNAKVFTALSKAAVPFLDSFLRLINALTPAALRLADRITDIGKRFQDLTKAEGYGNRIDAMMKRAEKTAGLLFNVIGNLGSAIANVFNISNPATNTFLGILGDVTQRFEDFTNSVKGKREIRDWAMNSVDVMVAFGRTIEAIFKVTSKLADSRVIVSFLTTVKGAFDYLNRLPLDKAVNAFVKLAAVMQPISSLFFAIIVGGVAFNILIGSMLGQLGGLFSVISRFGGLSKVLAFGPLVGGLVLLGVGIGVVISRSETLKAKLATAFDALKGVYASLQNAFGTLVNALKPVGDSLKPVLANLERLAGIAIGTVLDKITGGLRSLSGMIDRAATAIPGLVKGLRNFFKANDGKAANALQNGLSLLATGFQKVKTVMVGQVLPALSKFGGYIVANVVPILKAIGHTIVTDIIPVFVEMARFLVTTVIPAILLIVGAVAQRLAPVFKQIVATFRSDVLPTMQNLATTIRTKIVPALEPLIKKVLIVVGAVLTLAGAILGKVLPPLIKLSGFIIKTVVPFLGDMLVVVIKIISGVLSLAIALGKAGIHLYEFGKGLIQTVGGAIGKVIGIITGLPGFIIGLVPKMLNAGKHLMGGFFDGLKHAAEGVGGFLGDVGSSVVGAIIGAFNKVVDFINDSLPDVIHIKFAPDIDLPDNPIPRIPGYARGTRSYPGGLGLVGEDGPELVTLPRGSRISTNAQTRALAQGLNGEGDSGGNIYIANMMPHNYSEFERQMREKNRLAAIGGRRPVTA